MRGGIGGPRTALVLGALALCLAGCSSSGPGPDLLPPSGTPWVPGSSRPASPAPPSASPAPARGSVEVTGTVAKGIRTPWGLAVLPGGDLLVSSRDTGVIWHVDVATGRTSRVGAVPGVAASGEGGLLGIAVSPSYSSDHLIYAYFTTDSDNRIASLIYNPAMPPGEQLGAPDTIVRALPKGATHNGGRIAFGPDGMLYAGTGDTGDKALARNPTSPAGKILRMTPEGAAAPGNPTPGSPVYSTGHSDVEGLAWDQDKRLWASDSGQRTWDELNLIQPGGDYGWPAVEGKAGTASGAGYLDPVVQWHPADASPSGVAYDKGCLWVAALRGTRLWRVPLDGTRASAPPQAFLTGKYGRLRSLAVAPDGSLLVTTSNTDGPGRPAAGDDRILRLTVS